MTKPAIKLIFKSEVKVDEDILFYIALIALAIAGGLAGATFVARDLILPSITMVLLGVYALFYLSRNNKSAPGTEAGAGTFILVLMLEFSFLVPMWLVWLIKLVVT